MKGQTSIELVATVGIALVLAAPFVIQAQDTMIDISFGSDTAEIQASLDRLSEAIRTVGSMGEPATRRVQLRLTRDMEGFQVSGNRSLIYTMERSGRQTNLTRIFDSKISASNIPVKQGIYTIEVEAWKDQVNISNLSPSGAPLTQLLTISSQKDWNQGSYSKSTADEVVTEYNYISEFEASTQSEFNQGMFNGSSADRKDNSGDLGLGYRNGTTGDNLVGYWRLDSDSAKDYSGNGNDGSLNGGVTVGNRGLLSTESFSFDGNDGRVIVPDSTEFDSMSDGFTIAGWYNTRGFVADNRQTLVRKPGSFVLYPRDSGMDSYIWGVSNNRLTKGDVPENQWVHLAVTYNGNDKRVHYINGTDVGSNSPGSGMSISNNDLAIGADPTGGYAMNGSIDEVRIYDEYLSKAEIRELYFKGMDGKFNGSYTAKKIDNNQETVWDRLEVNASVPSDTSVNATFKALDSSGSLVDSQVINVNSGLNNYSLSVSDSEDAEAVINGSSSNVTKTWEVYGLEVFSSEVEDKIEGLRIGYRNGSTGDDLVGYWRFDRNVSGNGGTVKDYSGEGNSGITQNGVKTGSKGAFSSNGFEFQSGGEYVDTGNPSMAFNPLSISLWVKPDDVSTGGQRLVYRDDSSDWALSLGDPGTGRLRFYTRDLSTTSLDTGQIIEKDEWYHFVAIWDSANGVKQIWVNNSLEAEQTGLSGSLSNGGDPIKLGGSGSKYIDGSMDEVRIYNRVLSSSEVKDLYFNGRPFQSNYTAEKIDNDEETGWDELEVNASIPSDTSVNATFKALDTNGNLVDSQLVDLNDGLSNYSLSVDNSEDGDVFINGTSSNVTKSWSINDLNVYGR